MKRRSCLLVVVGLFGCASADRIERAAARHEARADALASEGDYVAASKERVAADKQYSKANSRRGFENAMPIVFR